MTEVSVNKKIICNSINDVHETRPKYIDKKNNNENADMRICKNVKYEYYYFFLWIIFLVLYMKKNIYL